METVSIPRRVSGDKKNGLGWEILGFLTVCMEIHIHAFTCITLKNKNKFKITPKLVKAICCSDLIAYYFLCFISATMNSLGVGSEFLGITHRGKHTGCSIKRNKCIMND